MMYELKVSDIKQYFYCPRIIYFHYVCPVKRKATYKMEEGKENHLALDKLEKRRTLKRYKLTEGERIFHTELSSPRLGLHGKLDMHIVTPRGYFPVEFKFTERGAALNHKYQLIGYAMLLEDFYNFSIRYGLLYLVPRQEILPVEITPNARTYVNDVLDKIRNIIVTERMPDKTRHIKRCYDCEYRRFCGDIDDRRKEKKTNNVFFN